MVSKLFLQNLSIKEVPPSPFAELILVPTKFRGYPPPPPRLQIFLEVKVFGVQGNPLPPQKTLRPDSAKMFLTPSLRFPTNHWETVFLKANMPPAKNPLRPNSPDYSGPVQLKWIITVPQLPIIDLNIHEKQLWKLKSSRQQSIDLII